MRATCRATSPIRGGTYRIPPYDLEALLVEADLLVEWYAPHIAGPAARLRRPGAIRERLAVGARGPALAEPKTWTLRDVHSPNVLWLPRRDGVRRVGLIDFQDCVHRAAGL